MKYLFITEINKDIWFVILERVSLAHATSQSPLYLCTLCQVPSLHSSSQPRLMNTRPVWIRGTHRECRRRGSKVAVQEAAARSTENAMAMAIVAQCQCQCQQSRPETGWECGRGTGEPYNRGAGEQEALRIGGAEREATSALWNATKAAATIPAIITSASDSRGH